MEVMMGRHPGGLISDLLTPNGQQILVKDVIDQRLQPQRRNRVAEEVISTMKLSFTCLQANPHSRPTMQHVSKALTSDRPSPLLKPFLKISLGDLVEVESEVQG